MAIKIMIADDHSMIREGLKSLVELEGDIGSCRSRRWC